ncbi:MAG: hypothetical protein DMF22_01215 [Verrucomicrobia bacterium]|nr:MAG: hypothetical protein DME81_05355 [Verrucomicrobiota bacterium]PYJ53988.1 MAG: hypothetical protein DME83_00940 [Verrucomicrobiota bacterium]PYJ98012.1 MAG: hypothetical protein DME68_07670 [Verrucomicrobiota bacterium]PYL73560.1 MAG: hypothetical protein DMF22_01215 [Verrucomicrobiota bacterium]
MKLSAVAGAYVSLGGRPFRASLHSGSHSLK